MHLTFAVAKWLSLFNTTFFNDKKPIGVILLIIMVIDLC